MRSQRDFYEQGYKGLPAHPDLIISELEGLSANSRIGRAVSLLSGASGHLADIGCGSGALLYHMRRQFDLLTGVDIADVQLDRVRAWSSRVGCRVTLNRCDVDAETVPVPDGSVDVVTCIVLLEFVISPENVVREIARVLRPGGTFVASVGNIVSWKNRLRTCVGLAPQTTTFMGAVDGGALHHFTKSSFIGLLAKFGLMAEFVGCSGRYWIIRQWWPSLLGGDVIVRARKPSHQ